MGETVTAKAHDRVIDIQGVTVARVDDKVRLQKVETWFDPMEMFRQIAPNGIVNKEIVEVKPGIQASTDEVPTTSQKDKGEAMSIQSGGEARDSVTGSGNSIAEQRNAAEYSEVRPGNAIAAAPESEQTVMIYEEMSKITSSECPFMNKE